MLEQIEIEPYLMSGKIECVVCGGESGDNARPCHYDWILHTREQCVRTDTPFYFKQTGARFVKDGRMYLVQRKDQISQARKAGISTRVAKPPSSDSYVLSLFDQIKENESE